MTPEGKVKEKVKAILKTHKVWYLMPVPTGYQAKTIDFICCHDGRFFGIEAKAPGKTITDRQVLVKDAIEAAGGRVFEIAGYPGYAELIAYLTGVGDGNAGADN